MTWKYAHLRVLSQVYVILISCTVTEAMITWEPITDPGLGVYVGTTGLGVKSLSGDGNDLDGGMTVTDPNESLVFLFSDFDGENVIDFDNPETVVLESLLLTDMGANDGFSLDIDGVTVILDEVPNPTGDPALRDVLVPIGLLGTEFRVWAHDGDDDFRIAGLTVRGSVDTTTFDFTGGTNSFVANPTYSFLTQHGSTIIYPEVAPEPGTIALLGMGVLGWVGRGKRH